MRRVGKDGHQVAVTPRSSAVLGRARSSPVDARRHGEGRRSHLLDEDPVIPAVAGSADAGVYLGDLFNTARSVWDPITHDQQPNTTTAYRNLAHRTATQRQDQDDAADPG
jgi:hypothetical protein